MVPTLILLLALVLIVLPIWALLKILSLQASNERLDQRVRMLERAMQQQGVPRSTTAAVDTAPPVIMARTPSTPPPAVTSVPPAMGSLPVEPIAPPPPAPVASPPPPIATPPPPIAAIPTFS